jgi:cytochrome P450
MHLRELPVLEGAQPFWGHNRIIRNDRLGFFRRLAAADQPIFHLRVPGVHFACVVDPELIQDILVDKSKSFVKSWMLRWALYPLAGEGLFTSEDPLWRRQRKLMAPLFHRSQLDRYAEDMIGCAERTIAGWRDGGLVDLAPAMTRLTMGVAGKTLFDADTFDEADQIGEALTDALAWTSNSAGTLYAISHVMARGLIERAAHGAGERARPRLQRLADRFGKPLFYYGEDGRKLRAALALLDERVARMIAERRARPDERQDLLTKLLAARDEAGGGMDDKQVRDEVLTLFVAGHETTASALAWTFQLLGQHPGWNARVQAEVDALGGRAPTVDDLPRLGLCQRVFKEALRLYPPVYAFGRQTLEEVQLGDITIPPYTICMLSPFALHRRESLWPDPERFDPDRFLPAAEAQRHRYAWLPFGGGGRVCIGNHFALMEAPLVMATVLSRWRLEIIAREQPKALAALRPGGPMPARVHRRMAAARAA